MWIRIFFFIVIILTLINISLKIFINKSKENFENGNEKLYFDGSVHLKQNISVNNKPNKIRFDKLCFRKKTTSPNDEIKEECLDSDQFSFVMNNTSERNYYKCLGDVCVNNDHLNILRNKNNFKLKHLDTNKCYMMRDAMLHGVGGNYAELHKWRQLDNDLHPENVRRLRGKFDGKPRHGRTSDGGLYNEHMAGKLHDDDGDYWRWWAYVDGGWRNRPWIPNMVVSENCNLETDGLFRFFVNTQDKNQFRFIKTDTAEDEAAQGAGSDGIAPPVPPKQYTEFDSVTGFRLTD